MEENLQWIWIAFSLAWAIHLAYVYSLGSRQKVLKRQLEDLRAQLEDRGSAQ
jgi:hypothetical protein